MQHKVNHQGVRVQASIRLTDGSILNGTVNCGMTGRLESVLNAQDSFIEFISKTGQQRFISRHQIASVEPLDSMREPHLPHINENEEPFMVLGLRHGSTADAIRNAFERLSQAYADERWTGADIPPEITKYAADKLRQINAAYTVLRGEQSRPAPQPAAAPEQPQRPMFGQSAAPRPHVDAPSMAPAVPERPAMPDAAPSMTRPAAPAPQAAAPATSSFSRPAAPSPAPAAERPAFGAAPQRPEPQRNEDADERRPFERPLNTAFNR